MTAQQEIFLIHTPLSDSAIDWKSQVSVQPKTPYDAIL
jgi:hypothetical protein